MPAAVMLWSESMKSKPTRRDPHVENHRVALHRFQLEISQAKVQEQDNNTFLERISIAC